MQGNIDSGYSSAKPWPLRSILEIAAWVLQLLENKPPLPKGGNQRLSNVKGRIKMENVHFAYAGRPDVSALTGVNLEIEPGTTTAFVGRSGSGKSTIINLLLRFYDPTGGRIELDGHDIRDLDIQWLRGQIGIVMVKLTGTVRTLDEDVRKFMDKTYLRRDTSGQSRFEDRS